MHPVRDLLLVGALLLNPSTIPAGNLRSQGVAPHQLNDRLAGENPPLVIDVRSPDAYYSEHIPGAISIPAPTVNKHLDQIWAVGGNAVLYCNDLHFTRFAERLLMRKGMHAFTHLEGGLNSWRKGGQAGGTAVVVISVDSGRGTRSPTRSSLRPKTCRVLAVPR